MYDVKCMMSNVGNDIKHLTCLQQAGICLLTFDIINQLSLSLFVTNR